MPRGSIHTTTPPTPSMIEALQCAARGEPSRYFTELSEHGGRSYTWRALVDRGMLTEDCQITERGRTALASIGCGSANDNPAGAISGKSGGE